MAPSRHDWKIVDWDVKPQHNQPKAPWLHCEGMFDGPKAISNKLSYSWDILLRCSQDVRLQIWLFST